ncbi:hypothetical protein FA13DRAFT_959402 [Coprinellus micaceus]|uniref:Secreted protein n=1 Tax=Coprinellus micaceus TaxID=71717 RepID=A0A4Y7RWD7_COPMI|nr:hypothetical protein FA13DRAFT_959402 [Coprinellus micaceus]
MNIGVIVLAFFHLGLQLRIEWSSDCPRHASRRVTVALRQGRNVRAEHPDLTLPSRGALKRSYTTRTGHRSGEVTWHTRVATSTLGLVPILDKARLFTGISR